MVLSVFAGTVGFAGTAAAVNSSSIDVSPDDSDSSEAHPADTDLGAETTVDFGDTGNELEISFQTDTDSGSNDEGSTTVGAIRVTQPALQDLDQVDDSEVGIQINGGATTISGSSSFDVSVSGNTLVIDLESSAETNLGDAANVDVVIEDVTTPQSGGSYTAAVSLRDTSGSSFSSFDADFDVAANNNRFALSDTDEAVQSTGLFWQGQNLFFKANASSTPGTINSNPDTGKVYELRQADSTQDGMEVGTFVRELALDGNAETVIDTSNLEGDYVIEDEDGRVIEIGNQTYGTPGVEEQRIGSGGNTQQDEEVEDASFEIAVQSLSTAFQENEVTQDETFLDVTSNRGNYNVTVTADGISSSTIVDIFDDELEADRGDEDNDGSLRYDLGGSATDVYESDDGVVLRVRKQNANITANFSGVDTGDYTFEFDVNDTDASASDSVSNTEAADIDARFRQSVVPGAVGDNVAIPITLTNTDSAKVNIGYNDVNFNTTFTIEDGDDNGVVTVNANLYAMGNPNLLSNSNPALATVQANQPHINSNQDAAAYLATQNAIEADDEDDTVSNVNLTTYGNNAGSVEAIDNPPLDPGAYDMNITTGYDNNLNPSAGNERAVGTLSIVEASTEGMQSWTLPDADFDDLSDETDVWAGIEDGSVTQDNGVANDDIIIWQIQTNGVYGALSAAKDSGESDTDAFVDLVRGTNLIGTGAAGFQAPEREANGWLNEAYHFRVAQDNPDTNQDPLLLDLNATDNNNGLTVIRDPANRSLFVAIDTDSMQFARQDDAILNNRQPGYGSNTAGNQDVPLDEPLRANFTIQQISGIYDDGGDQEVASDTARVIERELSFDTDEGGVVRVRAESGQTISGTTSVAPGTDLDLRVRSTTAASPFLRNPAPEVQTDQSFNASVDFSGIADNTTFEVGARGFDGTTPGRVGQAATAAVTFSDQETSGDSVVVDSATLSEGGFIAIHQGSASGPVVGNSDYLEPGTVSNVEIQLDTMMSSSDSLVAMPHLDTNGNEAYDFPGDDGPYTAGGAPVTDLANITIATPTPTPTETETPTPTPTETETPTPSPTPTDTPTPEGPDTTTEPPTTTSTGPGFTAGIALIALAGAALLAARRRDN
jgi:PGF-CTERM protein